MPNRLLIAALAATMTLVACATASADSVKKKKTAAPAEQSEKSAEQEAMEDAVFDAALDVFGGAMKKGKMSKGGKEVMKQGLKAVKNAKKDADKKESAKKKDPLKALFGGGDDEE